MADETLKKRREAQERLSLLPADIARHDDSSVWISGEALFTVQDLEALVYLMRERADWQLSPGENE